MRELLLKSLCHHLNDDLMFISKVHAKIEFSIFDS